MIILNGLIRIVAIYLLIGLCLTGYWIATGKAGKDPRNISFSVVGWPIVAPLMLLGDK